MNKTFTIATDTTPVTEFAFAGQQEERSKTAGCTRAFRFRFIQGRVELLPNYILNAIKAEGMEAVYLGGTTYKYSVIGLRPVA